MLAVDQDGTDASRIVSTGNQQVFSTTTQGGWGCHHGQNQEWTYTGGTLQTLGMCLDAFNQGTTAGTCVDMYTCNGQSNRQWSKVQPRSGPGPVRRWCPR